MRAVKVTMKIAVIDLGTNTFHLLLATVKEGSFSVIYREKTAVKIGEKGINNGMITPEASKRALTAMHRFKAVIDTENIQEIYATATSAIRNANNGRDLIAQIKRETGIKVRIISGLQEASFIYYGVSHAMSLGQHQSLIMDIGGGSIEFIIANNEGISWMKSFEIGGQRMMDHFQKHDPILPNEIEDVEKYLDDNLQSLLEAVEQYKPSVLVGSSGSFDTLSDMYRVARGIEKKPTDTEYPLTQESFYESLELLTSKNREQRLAIPGMIELRVDMIVVATILIKFVLQKTKIKDIRVSAYALKEGVLLDTIHRLPAHSKRN